MAKRKSKTYEVYGEFRFYRGFEQNRDMVGPLEAFKKYDGACVTDLIMDEENKDAFEASESQWKVYTNKSKNKKGELIYKDILEDGQYLIKPRRMFQHPIAEFGGPPVTELATGERIDPTEGIGVGNGSKGYVQFTVYEGKAGMGSRWEGAQITKWVQYPLSSGTGANFSHREMEGIEEYEADDEDEDETPKAATKSAVKRPVSKSARVDDDYDLDDEIPF